jgi:RNA polymerase sigma factor (TIGR02999 family)
MTDVTQILSAIDQGDPHAAGHLLPLVYDELRQLAAHKLAQEKPGQTLQATALVHEAYLRLVGSDVGPHWNSRGHFFAAAAEAMRRILVENARRKHAKKRGREHHRITLDEAEVVSPSHDEDWLLLDDAVSALAREDPATADVANLRLFAGMSVEEAAEVLHLSRATAFRHWTYARAWLNARLRDAP